MSGLTPVQVFRVQAEDDSGYPRGAVGYFTSEFRARTAAKGKGAWGSDGRVDTAWAVSDGNGKFHILVQEQPLELDIDYLQAEKDAKAAALAKLTPHERQLLGLRD